MASSSTSQHGRMESLITMDGGKGWEISRGGTCRRCPWGTRPMASSEVSPREKFPASPRKNPSPLTRWGKGLGNLPWRNLSKMPLVHTPYGIFGSSASEKFPCKPVKDFISSNNVGERVGKSPVAELVADALGAPC